MSRNLPPITMQLDCGQKPKQVKVVSPGAAFTSEVSIDLLDGIGKAVDQKLVFVITDSHECSVDLSTTPLGVYHLRIVDENIFFVKRIILN